MWTEFVAGISGGFIAGLLFIYIMYDHFKCVLKDYLRENRHYKNSIEIMNIKEKLHAHDVKFNIIDDKFFK